MSAPEPTPDLLVALVGNPNTGKSSIFNALTGFHQHVANWPGKTVEVAHGDVDMAGARVRLVDLPGTYSLDGSSPEEEITRNYLVSGDPDAVVIVVDATNLERNLYLAVQVLEVGLPAVIALTMVDVATSRGLEVDAHVLADRLGVPVIPTAARQRKGLGGVLDAIIPLALADSVR
ncbi:MAG TPA: FeoB small GTPase domain-containing protein [Acidimicrobiia bacterium]|nr:FeoB small GTPase domain-containing protein [Acidimicrobiia bacterium]